MRARLRPIPPKSCKPARSRTGNMMAPATRKRAKIMSGTPRPPRTPARAEANDSDAPRAMTAPDRSPRRSRFAARSVSVARSMAPALARPMPFTKYFVAVDPKLWFLFPMARLKAFDEDKAIDSAVDCFWARGYEAPSVRDLAERMDIGGASLCNA